VTATISVESARVYRAGDQRFFTKRAACKHAAKETLKYRGIEHRVAPPPSLDPGDMGDACECDFCYDIAHNEGKEWSAMWRALMKSPIPPTPGGAQP